MFVTVELPPFQFQDAKFDPSLAFTPNSPVSAPIEKPLELKLVNVSESATSASVPSVLILFVTPLRVSNSACLFALLLFLHQTKSGEKSNPDIV